MSPYSWIVSVPPYSSLSVLPLCPSRPVFLSVTLSLLFTPCIWYSLDLSSAKSHLSPCLWLLCFFMFSLSPSLFMSHLFSPHEFIFLSSIDASLSLYEDIYIYPYTILVFPYAVFLVKHVPHIELLCWKKKNLVGTWCIILADKFGYILNLSAEKNHVNKNNHVSLFLRWNVEYVGKRSPEHEEFLWAEMLNMWNGIQHY